MIFLEKSIANHKVWNFHAHYLNTPNLINNRSCEN